MPSRPPTKASSSKSTGKVSVRKYDVALQTLQHFIAEARSFTDEHGLTRVALEDEETQNERPDSGVIEQEPQEDAEPDSQQVQMTDQDYEKAKWHMQTIESASRQAFTSFVHETWRFGELSHTNATLDKYNYLAECASEAAKDFHKKSIPNLDFMSTLSKKEVRALSSLSDLMTRRFSSNSEGMAKLVLDTLRTVTQGRKLSEAEAATRTQLISQLTAAVSEDRTGKKEYKDTTTSAGLRPVRDSEYSQGGPAGSTRGDVIG